MSGSVKIYFIYIFTLKASLGTRCTQPDMAGFEKPSLSQMTQMSPPRLKSDLAMTGALFEFSEVTERRAAAQQWPTPLGITEIKEMNRKPLPAHRNSFIQPMVAPRPLQSSPLMTASPGTHRSTIHSRRPTPEFSLGFISVWDNYTPPQSCTGCTS